MTKRELERRLEDWRRRLTPAWRTELFYEPTNDDEREKVIGTKAVSWCSDDYHRIRIFIGTRFDWDDDQEAEVTIVHELLHAVTRDLRMILDHYEEALTRPMFEAFRATFSHAEEAAVEKLARALVLGKVDGRGTDPA